MVTVAWLIDAYLNGADGALPWQTIGSEKALDDNDAGAFGGNALLVPAMRFDQTVVADLRLKANVTLDDKYFDSAPPPASMPVTTVPPVNK